MNGWKPISAAELTALIARDLSVCSPEERKWFDVRRIPLRSVPILRDGAPETVFLVAQDGSSVIYYEDVEEGFNIASLSTDGQILKPGYEQRDLNIAIKHWAQQIVAADRREDAAPAER